MVEGSRHGRAVPAEVDGAAAAAAAGWSSAGVAGSVKVEVSVKRAKVDMLQATCLSCEMGTWHIVRSDLVCFFSQTLTRRRCHLGGGGIVDMFTLHRGRDTCLGDDPQV